MKTLPLWITLSLWFSAAAFGLAQERRAPQDPDALLERAEELWAEGSFALALEAYQELSSARLDDDRARWVAFRVADCRWRSAASTQNADPSSVELARTELEALTAGRERVEQRDRVWAEARESLADLHWDRQASANWGMAQGHYQAALDWWAGSGEIDLARKRYLSIVWRMASPVWYQPHWGYGSYGNRIDPSILRNAVTIAQDAADVDRAHYLLGLSYFHRGRDPRVASRLTEALEHVVERGRASEWYDDALLYLGRYQEESGSANRDENGNWQWTPDYAGAAETYRKFLQDFNKGESRHWDDVRRRLENITRTTLGLSVSRFFLPESEIQYRLDWRNASRIELALHPVDLTRDVQLSGRATTEWLEAIQLGRREAVRSWTHATEDTGEHVPGFAQLTLDEKLPLGAYVLEARAAGESRRALVLVSDLVLTLKDSGREHLVWVCDARSGEPVADAELRLWHHYRDKGKDLSGASVGRTGADGIARFESEIPSYRGDYFLAAKAGERQGFVAYYSYTNTRPELGWKVYAQTDRPAYRPGDLVQWKFTVRAQGPEGYLTPAGARLRWEILDPRGTKQAEGEGELNSFGTLWGSLETNADLTLGEYRVQFWRAEDNQQVGAATLFRLEEYKAPEFEVTVLVPEDPETSRPRLFRLGEEVTFDLEATYYFGAPVAGADVEVFVYQRPFHRTWTKSREFPWFYTPSTSPWWGGQGQQVSHQTLETDAAGRTSVTFETPFELHQDYEYTIEARVVDASRREILASETVRVTRQEYFVNLEPQRAIHRPGTAVEVDVRAEDANGHPVEATGTMEVTRRKWIEVWRDPAGRKVHGQELRDLKQAGSFPPSVDLPFRPWSLEFQGYETEVVARGELTTGTDGRGRWSFTPDRDGSYQIAWRSVDGQGEAIDAQAHVFVADEKSRELGYMPGGIEILVDQDTLAVGETASVLLAAPASGRWVLFTVEAEDLLQHQVVRLDGTVKLIALPIDQAHVPNVYLGALSVADGITYQDVEEIVVPPRSEFLDVNLSYDAEDYLPGSEGTLTVDVRDHKGQPVSAELAVGVFDDSLSYIQTDYAIDPRQFFYGTRRGLEVRTHGMLHQRPYVQLKKDEDGGLYDERFGMKEEGAQRRSGDGRYVGPGDTVPPGGGRAELRTMAQSNAPMESEMLAEADQAFLGKAAGASGQGPGNSVQVRSDFRDTALWVPDLRTDASGRASVSVSFPDSTTRWQAVTRAVDANTRVGEATTNARTRQPLIVRLQVPRFFQVGDEALCSGNVNNESSEDLDLTLAFEAEGLEVLGWLEGGELVTKTPQVRVPAGDQVRVDWKVRVTETGTARLLLSALGAEHSDAVRRELPIHPRGVEVFLANSGKFDGDEVRVQVRLPAERAPGSTSLEVQVSPSLAVTLLDALPYLVDYPYGCTEQTMSRFLPCVIVTRTLAQRGLSPEAALERVFGGLEAAHLEHTQPKGKGALERLDEMTARGLERLRETQKPDGGWGWWSNNESDAFMTAYVLWGLCLARESGLEVEESLLQRAAGWLSKELVELEERPDEQAWLLHGLTAFRGRANLPEAEEFIERAFDNLWERRRDLNAYARALLTLSASRLGHEERAATLSRNLANGVQLDRTPDTSVLLGPGQASSPHVLATAHWGRDTAWTRWSDGGIEATAFSLMALLQADPEHELIEPTVAWLVKNRRGAQWSNTRDTAISVLALNAYLEASGELDSPVGFELFVNGELVGELSLKGEQLLAAPSRFTVEPGFLIDGPNEVRIRRTAGDSPLYFAAHATFFSQEAEITARGSEVFVRRDYYKLVGRPTLLKGLVYDRVPLLDGQPVQSGERVEVVLTVEAKNDLEYLIFEDLKPAGLEAVEVKSGGPLFFRELKSSEVGGRFEASEGEAQRTGAPRGAHGAFAPEPGTTGRSRSAHRELRDSKVALFVDRLPQGTWEVRYDLRAEVPGRFEALPTLGHAMYVPEIRCNGTNLRLEVTDRP